MSALGLERQLHDPIQKVTGVVPLSDQALPYLAPTAGGMRLQNIVCKQTKLLPELFAREGFIIGKCFDGKRELAELIRGLHPHRIHFT